MLLIKERSYKKDFAQYLNSFNEVLFTLALIDPCVKSKNKGLQYEHVWLSYLFVVINPSLEG